MNVLFVCNANECRSPLAHRHFETVLRRRGLEPLFSVRSAGVRAIPGRPMVKEYVRLLTDDDPACADFRSRALTPALLEEADVVVTMTRAELAEALRMRPLALTYTVTLRELAKCVDRVRVCDATDPAGQLASLVHRTIRERGAAAPVQRGDHDIPDPVGRPAATLHRTAETIVRSVDQVTGLLYAAQLRLTGSFL
nr:hypothetical protein [Lentzea atacamensis]